MIIHVFVSVLHTGAFSYDNLLTWLGARPVINLKSNITITKGSGTESDPYMVGQN